MRAMQFQPVEAGDGSGQGGVHEVLLDARQVVCIGGAGDYAEVTTLTGKHLVRVTLAEFAGSLDPAKYVRVHRSWIVNTDRIARLESAGGGRLLLHLETGQTISTSREGASLLRSRVP